MRNMLSGFAEKEHISDFAFETQRKTYHSSGYAQDPSKPLTEEEVGVDKQVKNISMFCIIRLLYRHFLRLSIIGRFASRN